MKLFFSLTVAACLVASPIIAANRLKEIAETVFPRIFSKDASLTRKKKFQQYIKDIFYGTTVHHSLEIDSDDA